MFICHTGKAVSSFQKLELYAIFSQAMTTYLSVRTCAPEHAPLAAGISYIDGECSSYNMLNPPIVFGPLITGISARSANYDSGKVFT